MSKILFLCPTHRDYREIARLSDCETHYVPPVATDPGVQQLNHALEDVTRRHAPATGVCPVHQSSRNGTVR